MEKRPSATPHKKSESRQKRMNSPQLDFFYHSVCMRIAGRNPIETLHKHSPIVFGLLFEKVCKKRANNNIFIVRNLRYLCLRRSKNVLYYSTSL